MHQFQYMGKRYIARYCGDFRLKCGVICSITFLYSLDLNVWELLSLVIGSWNSHKQPMKTVGRSLDCYHKICQHLSPTFLLSCFVSCISLGMIFLCGLLLHFYFSFQILRRVLFLLSLLSLIPVLLDVSSGSVLFPQLFLFPCFIFKGHLLPLHLPKILISLLTTFFLNERIFSVHLKFV